MTHVSRVLLLLLLTTTPASAATLYVATTGSDGSPCSQQAPCRTINGGIARLQSGDVLIINGGTYHEILTHIPAGSPGAFTTIRAAQAGTVRLTATPQGEITSLIELISAQQHHIRIEGLELDGGNRMTNCGQFLYSHDLEFVNVDCHHAQNGFIGSSRNVAFINTTSRDHGAVFCQGRGDPNHPPPNDGYCHGWYLATMEDNPGPWTFEGVTADRNNGYGLQAYHMNFVVRNSVFRDNGTGGIVAFRGEITNNCFERNRLHAILCDGCSLSGNRINQGGCATPVGTGEAPAAPRPPPRPSAAQDAQ